MFKTLEDSIGIKASTFCDTQKATMIKKLKYKNAKRLKIVAYTD